MEERYRYNEASYDALDRAGVGWVAAHDLLHGERTVRRHLGAGLNIAGRARDGRWISVTLIEETDDEYLVVRARELDPDEAATIARLLGGHP